MVGWKGRAFWDCLSFKEHASANKDQGGEQKWLEQGVIVGLQGPLENTCMWWLWKQGTLMSKCQQLGTPGQPLSRPSIWAQLLTGCSNVCMHTLSLPELPPAPTELSQGSLCMPYPWQTLTEHIHACWGHILAPTGQPWGMKQQLPCFSRAVGPSTTYFPPRQNRCFQATTS